MIDVDPIIPDLSAGQAADYVGILHLMSIYHTALDAGDFDTFSSVFADDGVLAVTGGKQFIGKDVIRQSFEERRAERLNAAMPGAFQRHHLTTRRIELRSDTASAECYYLVLTEQGLDHFGRYFDTYRRTSKGWRIEHRRSELDWMHAASRFRVNTSAPTKRAKPSWVSARTR